MPQPAGREASPGFEMEIETRGVHVLAAMREAHGKMRFIGTLVGGKAGVAIDAKQRSAGAARVSDQMRRDVIEWPAKIGDELDRGLARAGLIVLFVGEKPVTVILALEASQEAEEFGSEIGWNGLSHYLT